MANSWHIQSPTEGEGAATFAVQADAPTLLDSLNAPEVSQSTFSDGDGQKVNFWGGGLGVDDQVAPYHDLL